MKEKTAMQMLIKQIEDIRDRILPNDICSRFAKGRVVDCIVQAKSLLKKEQEQIEQAFYAGYHESSKGGLFEKEFDDPMGKNYYKSKYGGENVDR